MTFDVDHANPQVIARCYRQRIPLPGLISLDRDHNVVPRNHLETIVTTGQGPAPDIVVKALGLDHHVSVATAARLLLDRLSASGQLPGDNTAQPMPVNARDDVEALGHLARCHRAERPVPAQVRVGAAMVSKVIFLDGFTHDRRECPSSIASDTGVMDLPASMREVAVSLLGRLRKVGAL